MILGSGLGGFADSFERRTVIPYADLPDFPRTSVLGHEGRLVLGFRGEVPMIAMQGRVHLYEGYSPAQVGFPARVLCRLGLRVLVVTNAAGGINLGYKVGDLMALTDHLNLSGFNPSCSNDDLLGPRFPDLTQAYDPGLLQRLRSAARAEGVSLREGVYACLAGPSDRDARGDSHAPHSGRGRRRHVHGSRSHRRRTHGREGGWPELYHQPCRRDDEPEVAPDHEVSQTTELVKDVFGRLLGRFLDDAAGAA